MLSHHINVIQQSLSSAIGADITISQKKVRGRDLVELWFSDLDRVNGPIIELSPTGTRRHHIALRFGSFSSQIINQIKSANEESLELARSLISLLNNQFGVRLPLGMTTENWRISDIQFSLEIERIGIDEYLTEGAIVETCNNVITPILGALAELIGYENKAPREAESEVLLTEGEKYLSIVARRERNPRNRLLCLQIHGDICSVCGLMPSRQYPSFMSIMEVHHIEALAELVEPKIYDPAKDLVPLCPNCHRAIHTKRPPYMPDELRGLMSEI